MVTSSVVIGNSTASMEQEGPAVVSDIVISVWKVHSTSIISLFSELLNLRSWLHLPGAPLHIHLRGGVP